jgi:membrane protein
MARLRTALSLLGRMILDHMQRDEVLRMAASLSYTSLLAMVPLLAIALAMLTAFPVLAEVRGTILDTLFQVLFPYADADVRTKVEQFVDAAGGLTALGVVGIAVTAVMLLVTIETALNGIFGVRATRALPSRLLVYWAVVTLGPLLLGASASLSGYLHALRDLAMDGPAVLTGLGGLVARAVPWILAAAAFTLLYLVVPNRPVRPLDALAGGVVAAVLVAALRTVFLVYVTDTGAYQTLYGALAVIPVFLVWMYLSWLVVLAGAVIAAVLPSWRMRRAEGDAPGRRDLIAALRVLAALQDAATQGTTPNGGPAGVGRRRLLAVTGLPEERLRRILGELTGTGLLARAEGGRWLLARDLDAVTLDDLLGLLHLRLPEAGGVPAAGAGWAESIGRRLEAARAAERDALAVPLKPLLTGAL